MTTAFIVLAVIVLAPVTSLILAVMLFGFPTEEDPTEEEVLRSLATGAKTASDVTVETGKLLGGAWSALEELERQRLVTSYRSSEGRRYWCLTRLGESDLRITGGRKKDV